MSLKSSAPNPVDIYVGGRIRVRRKLMGVSQGQLAAAVHLTFQQIQKYERGANRVSSSKLYEIGKSLQVPVAYFFDGYKEGSSAEDFSDTASEQFVHGFLMTSEGIELAETFPKVNNPKHRRRILDLVRVLAED